MKVFYGILGGIVGVLAIAFLYIGTMALYYWVRKKRADSKFGMEILFFLCVFVLATAIKMVVQWMRYPTSGFSDALSNVLFTLYNAIGSAGFGGLAHTHGSGIGAVALTLYYGSSFYVSLIFISLIGARVSYEAYSSARLVFSFRDKDVYIFTALTEESFTLAKSIKERRDEKRREPLIVFGGPVLAPFDRKNELCRRVMAEGFLYCSYSAEKKGSIAKILHLNNHNKEDFAHRFMIFAFDAKDHVPEEEDNLGLVIEDMERRKRHTDRLFIEYVVLTKRKINYAAYQTILDDTLSMKIGENRVIRLNGSWKNTTDVIDAAMTTLNAETKKTFTICALGIGYKGRKMIAQAFDHVNGDHARCIVETFDDKDTFLKRKAGDQIGTAEYFLSATRNAILEKLKEKGSRPILAYNYNAKDDSSNAEHTLLMKKICGDEETEPADLITVAVGRDDKNLAFTNLICKWIVAAHTSRPDTKMQYVVLSHKNPLKEGWLALSKDNNVAVKKEKDNSLTVTLNEKPILKIATAQYSSANSSLSLFNEAREAGRSGVRKIMNNGLIAELCTKDKEISAWAIGFGGTGEAITSELFVQTPGIVNGKSRPFAVSVFDPKIEEAGEIFRAEHDEGYTILEKDPSDPSKEIGWDALLKIAKSKSEEAQGLPAPVYAFHKMREKDGELYKMKSDLLGENPPDVITIATGDDYRNISYANVIAQWIVNAAPTRKTPHKYYMVVSVFDKDNDRLLSTFGAALKKERIIEVESANLVIVIVNNLEEVYSFDNYINWRSAAIQMHDAYGTLVESKTAVWMGLSELCKQKAPDEFRSIAKEVEACLIKHAVPPNPDPAKEQNLPKEIWILIGRLNGLFDTQKLYEKKSIKQQTLNYEEISLWEKLSHQSVISAEAFYSQYFIKQIQAIFKKHPIIAKGVAEETNETDKEAAPVTSDEKAREAFSDAVREFKDNAIAVEHDRWVRQHLSDGWVYRSSTTEAMKQHDRLLSYSDLQNEQSDALAKDLAKVMWAVCDFDPYVKERPETPEDKA